MPLGDPRFVQIDKPGFRSRDQQSVVRQRVAHRPQTVAVEFRSHPLPIREDQRRGPIPRLGLLRKRLERIADIPREQGIFFVRRRHHGQHRFFRREPGEQPQLNPVVETRGVADVVFQNRKPRPYLEPFLDLPFLGAQPPPVRDDGVDLAVVGHVAERLG